MVAPVLVTVEPASTPKFAAVPKSTLAASAPLAKQNKRVAVNRTFRNVINRVFII